MPGRVNMGTDRWTDELLDGMRKTGDADADAAVATVDQQGDDSLRAVLSSLVRHEGVVLEDLPDAMRTYFLQTEGLPDWADRDKIATGEQVFVRHGPEMAAILFCV